MRTSNRNGRFIVFEGLDGSGKSTQIDLLAASLAGMGVKVARSAEPTASVTGGIIRDALSGAAPRTQEELAALFLADRINHNVNRKNGIEKLLSEGYTVLCDRYYYSSFAYQGLDADEDWVMDMNLRCPAIRRPDLCVFLDIDPEKCEKRFESGRAFLEIFETPEVLAKVRDRFVSVFKKLEDRENIVSVDAARPAADVAADVLRAVMRNIEK